LQLSPANDAASLLTESLENESKAFEAEAQSLEVVKPGDGPLYNPACFSQTSAVRLAAACDFRGNADRT
jgi:hypothetical protein